MSKHSRCLACALNPIVLPGLLFGFMPIVATCPHLDKRVTEPSFRKSATHEQLGKLWVSASILTATSYLIMILQASGFYRLQLMSEFLTCVTSTCVLFLGFKKTNVAVLEMNGLCTMVTNNRLLSDPNFQRIRTISIVTVVIFYSLFLLMLTNIFALPFNTRNFFHASGTITGGIAIMTIFSLLWLKMIVMINMFGTLNLRVKRMLTPRVSVAAVFQKSRSVVADIEEAVRAYSAISRNYRECHRFWNPTFAISVTISCGNLVLGFYIMAIGLDTPSADYRSHVMLQMRISAVILELVLVHVTQQWLEDVVSTITAKISS